MTGFFESLRLSVTVIVYSQFSLTSVFPDVVLAQAKQAIYLKAALAVERKLKTFFLQLF